MEYIDSFLLSFGCRLQRALSSDVPGPSQSPRGAKLQVAIRRSHSVCCKSVPVGETQSLGQTGKPVDAVVQPEFGYTA